MSRIRGTNKRDRLQDTEQADLIIAKGGDDRITHQGGADQVNGGTGNDRLHALAVDEFSFLGGDGYDVLELYAKLNQTPSILRVDNEIVGVSYGNGQLVELEGVEKVNIHYVDDWPF